MNEHFQINDWIKKSPPECKSFIPNLSYTCQSYSNLSRNRPFLQPKQCFVVVFLPLSHCRQVTLCFSVHVYNNIMKMSDHDVKVTVKSKNKNQDDVERWSLLPEKSPKTEFKNKNTSFWGEDMWCWIYSVVARYREKWPNRDLNVYGLLKRHTSL